MRIYGGGDMTDATQLNLDQTRSSREVVDNAGSALTPTTGASSSDFIKLSGIGDLVQQALSAGTDARAARVQQLKQLIDSNQYSIDPVAVSNAIISAHLAGE
ncbi:MAG TPA: flagellar biosynthesis anti-sigma factor FlgM [Bryobacteraceae bacterium]|nr:flagellar biosynthesis anti-sigma factor FlgM [Bryobacteraceae bacterium]